MEQRLQEYRRRKQREQQIQLVKTKLKNLFNFRFMMAAKPADDVRIEIKQSIAEESDNESVTSMQSELLSDTNENVDNVELEDDGGGKTLRYTLRAVYFLFWLTVYIIAIELKFGIVFLMFSALIGIYINTRTGPKKRNEISAYSVFNKNFVAIDGTLKAEHFERELRYGATAVR